MEYDEGEHCKEVYAHFGLAYCHSSVLESGLTNALMQTDFLARWKNKIETEGKKSFDRKTYEAEFDAFMKAQDDLTFGNLIKRFLNTMSVPDDLRTKLIAGKVKRDFLAHGFFRERSNDFAHREGRDRMISELTDMRELFSAIDSEVESLAAPIFPQLGVSQEVIEKYTKHYLEKARRGEL